MPAFCDYDFASVYDAICVMHHLGTVREQIPDLNASAAFLAALHSTRWIDVMTFVNEILHNSMMLETRLHVLQSAKRRVLIACT